MLSVSHALACSNLPQNHANYMDLQWDPSSQSITVISSGYNPSYDNYTPQPNDVVESEDNVDYIFMDVADAGGGGDGGGGTPPNDPQSDPSLKYLMAEPSQPGLLDCGQNPVDRISVIGRRVALNLKLPAAAFRVILKFFGGGGSGPGSSPENPQPTPGEAVDCPGESVMNEARASEQIRAAFAPLCTSQHRDRYFEVNFAGDKTGIYRGIGDCRFTINNTEIEAPDC